MTRTSEGVISDDGMRDDRASNGHGESANGGRRWFAVFTVHQHEQKVVERLRCREIESFVPTYEEKRVWKDRHKKTLLLPLFPTYIFAHLDRHDYARVLESPSVRRIVGDSRGPIALFEHEIEFLRSDRIRAQIRPYKGLLIGKKVRIRSGHPMAGVEGVLVRQEKGMQFVVSVPMINQHAAVHISAANLEALS
jgi:transcription antitermination factor NusG